MLRIVSPYQGQVLNHLQGVAGDDGLQVTVRGEASGVEAVSLNGEPVPVSVGAFQAPVVLRAGRNLLKAAAVGAFGRAEHELDVWYDPHRLKRYRFSVDDNSFWLREIGRNAAMRAEDQREYPQDRIEANLGHDGEHRGDRGGGMGVRGREPEIQRQQRRLQREDREQQQAAGAQQRGVTFVRICDGNRKVSHVQRAGDAVEDADRDQEQSRADEVQRHVMQGRDRAFGLDVAAAALQQAVGRDQQDLEEHEQIEDIAGQERAVQSDEQELVQDMEKRIAAEHPGAGIEQAEQRNQRGQHQHQRAQAIEHQHDAERRRPVAERIDLVAAAGRVGEQQDRDHDQRGA